MPTRIEWHHGAREDLKALDKTVQQRITDAVGRLRALGDPSDRLVSYTGSLKGLWKLRVGDYRLICDLKRDDQGHLVVVIHVVHRSKAYLARSARTIKDRANDN